MTSTEPQRPGATTDEVVPIGVDVDRALEMLGGHVFAGPKACLRELVANAADSIAALPPEQLGNVEIRIVPHPEEGRLSLSDRGVGMSREQARERLGTIFHSSKLPQGGAIGRFGIGFYSCFPLCTRVEVHTRTRQPGDPGTRVVYDGGGDLHLSTGVDPPPGTRIELHLRPEHRQLLDPETLAQLVSRDCDFVPFPICLGLGFQVLNRLDAPWYHADASADPIGEALRAIFGWDEPLLVLPLHRAQSPGAIRGALMIPRRAHQTTLRLYSHRVLIREDARLLLPETISPWVAGVVDVEDLPLVLSRDAPLEGSREVGELRRALIEHLAEGLALLARRARRDFRALLGHHGRALKEACLAEPRLMGRLRDHLEFPSSLRDSVTVAEILATRPAGTRTVIYADDPSVGAALVPLYNRSNIEILYMSDPQDARLRAVWGRVSDGEPVVFQRLDVDPPTSDTAERSAPDPALIRDCGEAVRQLFHGAVDEDLEIELRALGAQAPAALLSISDQDRAVLGFVDQVRHLARRDQLDQLPEELRGVAQAGLVDRLVEETQQTLILNLSDAVVEQLLARLRHGVTDPRSRDVLPRLARFLHGQALLGCGRPLSPERLREIASHQKVLLSSLLEQLPIHQTTTREETS